MRAIISFERLQVSQGKSLKRDIKHQVEKLSECTRRYLKFSRDYIFKSTPFVILRRRDVVEYVLYILNRSYISTNEKRVSPMEAL